MSLLDDAPDIKDNMISVSPGTSPLRKKVNTAGSFDTATRTTYLCALNTSEANSNATIAMCTLTKPNQ